MATRRGSVPVAEILARLDVAEQLRAAAVRIGVQDSVPDSDLPRLDRRGVRAELARFDAEIADLRATLRGP